MAAIRIAHAGDVPPIVLIVDENVSTLRTYSLCLEASGVWVATAHPSETVATACELKPDLVITDSYDDDSPGGSLLGLLKAHQETRDVPIILLSGTALARVPLATREAADLCLEKPVLPDTLLEAAGTLLRQKRDRLQQDGGGSSDGMAAESARSAGTEVRPWAREGDSTARLCPGCASALEWIERARLYGVEYDYYRWCEKGCGLYCYDRTNRVWVKLA